MTSKVSLLNTASTVLGNLKSEMYTLTSLSTLTLFLPLFSIDTEYLCSIEHFKTSELRVPVPPNNKIFIYLYEIFNYNIYYNLFSKSVNELRSLHLHKIAFI